MKHALLAVALLWVTPTLAQAQPSFHVGATVVQHMEGPSFGVGYDHFEVTGTFLQSVDHSGESAAAVAADYYVPLIPHVSLTEGVAYKMTGSHDSGIEGRVGLSFQYGLFRATGRYTNYLGQNGFEATVGIVLARTGGN